MVREGLKESGRSRGVVTRVAGQLGLGSETLRKWIKQAEIDSGERPGVTSEEHRRITEPERENRELRQANEIIKAAAAFLPREL
jgi:transposase